jgi:hypothetical protein
MPDHTDTEMMDWLEELTRRTGYGAAMFALDGTTDVEALFETWRDAVSAAMERSSNFETNNGRGGI